MTITVTDVVSGPYAAVAQSTFAVGFQSAGADEIEVTLDGEAIYDWTFDRDDDGTGTVTTTEPVTGEVYIYSKPDFTQSADFQRHGAWFPDRINPHLDRAAARDLYLRDQINRVLASTTSAIAAVMALGAEIPAGLRMSVTSYGATGGGIIDDVAAINETIDAIVETLGGKGTLYFPKGDYLVSATDNDMAIKPLPKGMNVVMAPGAWIKMATNSGPLAQDEDFPSDPTKQKHVLRAFTPLGDNILEINVDGQAIADGQDVQKFASTPQPNPFITYPVAVSAYFSTAQGLGAKNVTIRNSHFKNLNFAIQANGAQFWKVYGNRFERTEHSAILYQFQQGYDCVHNLTFGNDFREIGDIAVAHHSAAELGTATGIVAFNVITGNTALDCNLRTQGGAYNIEPGNDPLDHHNNVISLNTYRQTRTDLPHGVGGIVAHGTSRSQIIGNNLYGSFNSNGDFGITMAEPSYNGEHSFDNLVADNIVENWRGSGILADGTTNSMIVDNQIHDCGDSSNGTWYVGILLGLNHGTARPTVRGNRITFSDDNPYVDDTVKAISFTAIAASATLGPLDGAVIEANDMISPWGANIYINAAEVGSGGTNLNLLDNRVTRTDSTAAWLPGVEIYGASHILISRTILTNVRYGYVLHDCNTFTLSDGEQRGPQSFAQAYDFTGSVAGKVRNMRAPLGAVGVFPGGAGGEGTDTIWENDDLVPLPDYADDVAAAAGGVAIGGHYRNGSVRMIRVA